MFPSKRSVEPGRALLGALVLVAVCCAGLAGCLRDRIKPYEAAGAERGLVRVRINLHAPSARSVHVAGDFNDWAVPRYEGEESSDSTRPFYQMRKERDYWTANVLMSPGVHYYRFWVDGLYWMIDEASVEKTQTLSGDRRNIAVVR